MSPNIGPFVKMLSLLSYNAKNHFYQSVTDALVLYYFSMLERLAKFSQTLEPSFDNMQLIPGKGDSNLYVFQDLGS